MSTVLAANERKDLKHSTTTKLRNEGNFPAIVYGKTVQAKPIYINSADFTKAMREAGRNGVLTLTVQNETFSVMLHDIQTDPLKNEVRHADFQVVDMSKELDADVTVVLTGEAPGVKEGGVMQQAIHQLSIRALPQDIPSTIEADVSNLQIGDTITVGDISHNGKYEVNHEPTETVASILPPKQEEEIGSGEQQDEVNESEEAEIAENQEE
ncbi:50S ribosomal protein L25/general stress protein Ctc [Priestia abyssalis]|uniref:50S ribosomal protein L25/general stress protein Ctc n=1 Tax=Priestia abyssalis TaxID=1221450 RepID=UPI00099542B9|nr:50S ribosomal protein L25/general stress protein Ctc [Priestia abyssalis]